MAKNLFKKGLAVTATSALSVAALVGVASPAYAANELKLESAAGTVMAVTSDEVFTLKTSFAPGYSSSGNTGLVHYVITDTSSTPGTVAIDALANATQTSVDEKSEVTADVVATSDVDNSVVLAAATTNPASFLGVAIDGTVTASSYQVTVQAFVDSDDDNALDSDEWSSAVVTIDFLKHSAVTFSTDITGNVLGAGGTGDDVNVQVTSTAINLEQMPNDDNTTGSRFLVKISTTSVVSAGLFLDWNGDADKKYLEINESLNALDLGDDLAAGDSVKAEVFLYDGTITTVEADAQANISTTSALSTRIEVTAQTPLSAFVDTTTTANDDVTATTDASPDTATAVSGSGSFTVTVDGTYRTDYSAATIELLVDETGPDTLKAGGKVTVGGLTLENTSAGTTQKIEPTFATDADGDAVFTVSYSGLEDGDTFDILAKMDGVTSPDALSITIRDRVATSIYNTDAIGTNTESAQLVFAVDADVNLNYALVDQFGALWPSAGAYVTVSGGGKSSTASFVNGKASVTLAAFDAATTFSATTVTSDNGTAVVDSEESTAVKIGTQATGASITATGDAGTAAGTPVSNLNVKTQSNADTRVGESTVEVTGSSNSTISGTVLDSLNNPIAADVTLSAANVMFEHDGVFSVGSITVRSTSSGTYAVEAYSNTPGKQVITVTSGSATKTEEIYWPVAAASTGTALTLNAPDYVLPASTLQLTATLTDKFGNPVAAGGTNTAGDAGEDFAVSYTGPGLLVGSNPTAFNADGQAKLNYLLGANDTGTITVSFKYDQNGDADYTDADDLVVTKTITIGEDPGEKKVNAGSFKGYVAVYARGYEGQRLSAKIGADWVIVDPIVNNQENGTLHRTVDFTGAGVDIAVRIYIDRVLIDTINLTTK